MHQNGQDFATREVMGGFGSPERQLWCAVIDRALQDALDSVSTISDPDERHHIRDGARRWFERNGMDFRLTCESAGYDPDVLRRRVMHILAEHTSAVAVAAAAPLSRVRASG
jgi:hypothetical protein